MGYTKEDIIRSVEAAGVHFIRLQFTDIFGAMKNITLTSSQLEKCLGNQCMFDGSSIEGFVRIEESDMYLYPDLDSFVILPWYEGQEKVCRLICDVYTPDAQPFEGDPRYILRRAIKKAADMGFALNVGPECEFFLFRLDEDGVPTLKTNDEGEYFDLGPYDLGEDARSDICLTLEAMGFEIEGSHHEGAHGQHEIDFKYSPALMAADNILTFKMVVKTIAKRKKLHATFMPKPIYGIPGSGMHVNMSLNRNGTNAFCDESDSLGLSREAYSFIAGVMRHIRAITAVSNPLVNSYKRLVPGHEAPCYVAWSAKNRSPLIRVPHARGSATRLELRSPDPSCNPYLTIALVLCAGLEGIEQGLVPPRGVHQNIYAMSEAERAAAQIHSLPGSLSEALACYEQDPMMREVLGEHVYERYLAAKQLEWEDYNMKVHDWEIARYLIKQ